MDDSIGFAVRKLNFWLPIMFHYSLAIVIGTSCIVWLSLDGMGEDQQANFTVFVRIIQGLLSRFNSTLVPFIWPSVWGVGVHTNCGRLHGIYECRRDLFRLLNLALPFLILILSKISSTTGIIICSEEDGCVLVFCCFIPMVYLLQEREDKTRGNKLRNGDQVKIIVISHPIHSAHLSIITDSSSLCSNPNPRYLCSCRLLIAFDSIKKTGSALLQQLQSAPKLLWRCKTLKKLIRFLHSQHLILLLFHSFAWLAQLQSHYT